jgi:hypothetical protein
MKTQYRILLEIFIVLMIIIALGYCNKCVSKPTQHKTDIPITDAKVAEQIAGYNYSKAYNKVKIIEKLIPKYKDRWRTHYDTIYKQAPDTCHYYLDKLNAEKMASDSINDIVVKTYSDVITAGTVYLAKKDSVIKEQDIVIQELQDSIPKVRKHYLWKGRKQGFIGGVIAREAVNVGSKLIKP